MMDIGVMPFSSFWVNCFLRRQSAIVDGALHRVSDLVGVAVCFISRA
jgi:hypothetical protein